MRTKELYLDCETTGLDPIQNEILTLGIIIRIDGMIKEEKNICMKPERSEVSPRITEITGITKSQADMYGSKKAGYTDLIVLLDKYVDKFNKQDKYLGIGYNVNFDKSFLQTFFHEFKNDYLFSYFFGFMDIYEISKWLKKNGKIDSPNLKLETLIEKYSLATKAHNSLEDAKATMLIDDYFKDHFLRK